MSKKDAKLTYAILGGIAIAVIAVLASLYADRVAKNAEMKTAEMMAKAIKTGGALAGARSAPQTTRAARPQSGQDQQASLMRTAGVERQRNAPTEGGGASLGLTRSVETQAARDATPEGTQSLDLSAARSADTAQSRSAPPPASPAADAARSMPKQAAQAATPDGGTSMGASRSAGAQRAQAAHPTPGQASLGPLSRAATQTAQAAMPTGGQSQGVSLSRSAGALQTAAPAAQALPKSAPRTADIGMQAAKPVDGRSAPLVLTRASSAQTAQVAPPQRDMPTASRSLPPEANKAAQAPLALQRKWNPARSLEASPDEDTQEL